MSKPMTRTERRAAKKVLKEAIKVMEKGWCQGRNKTLGEDGSVIECCAIGAIAEARKKIDATYEASKDASRLLTFHIRNSSLFGRKFFWISEFNDHPGRTKEQVIQVMKATASAIK